MDSHSVYQTLEETRGPGLYRHRGITLVRGHGVVVWDDKGRSFIDCTAGYGVACLGHAHPELIKTVTGQAGALSSCSGSFGNDQRALLLQELCTVLPNFGRLFFCNSGTEANEAAIKFARLTTGRSGVVAAMGGFHGRTFGALSATWNPTHRTPFEPLVPGFEHVPYDDAKALDAAIDENTAAVILEIVQGEGGVRLGAPDFLQAAQDLCRARGALLIIDEVQTGFGRTGKLFALEHAQLEPDLLCLAKGIAGGFPMGAVALGPRVAKLPPGAHGSTFGGNPLACALARTTLRALNRDDLPGQAAEKGNHLMDGLRAIKDSRIRDVRGLGLMVGLELDVPVAPLVQALQDEGVLVLNSGPKVIRFLPPLVISPQVLDDVVHILGRVLAAPPPRDSDQ